MRGGSSSRPIRRPNSFSSFGPIPGSADSDAKSGLRTGGRIENPADIFCAALYIPVARPRPGFRRFRLLRSPGFFEVIMTERSSEGLDVRRRRLLFRAWRRGVREMDLIVGRFADVYIDQFDEPSLDAFERLIEVPNAELYAWVTGDESRPAEHDSAVLRQLIGFHAKTGAQSG